GRGDRALLFLVHSSPRPRRSDSPLPPLLRVLAGATVAVLLARSSYSPLPPLRRGRPPSSPPPRPAAGATPRPRRRRGQIVLLPLGSATGADFGPFCIAVRLLPSLPPLPILPPPGAFLFARAAISSSASINVLVELPFHRRSRPVTSL
ncbi:Os11g0307950, partial [Oryza sativa Japonica Group]